MPTYTVKNAIVDLGFIAGYLYVTDFGLGGLQETLDEVIDELEECLVMGKWDTDKPVSQCASRCLHDIGFIRGMLWEKPIPRGVAEALDRLIDFATGEKGFAIVLTHWRESAEPKEHQLSQQPVRPHLGRCCQRRRLMERGLRPFHQSAPCRGA